MNLVNFLLGKMMKLVGLTVIVTIAVVLTIFLIVAGIVSLF